jgi:hypothetical protein
MPANNTNHSYPATFQTGYPYIGMPKDVFNQLFATLMKQDSSIKKNSQGEFMGAEKNCSEMNPLDDLKF